MSAAVAKLLPFLAWRRRINPASLRADLVAGVIGALVVLPQALAFATLAGLPLQYGLYAAIVPAIVAALFGSSWQQVSGPTSAMALVVYSTLASMAAPGSPRYAELALTLSLMIGVIQLGFGLARQSALAGFVAPTVITGFGAGAGILIVAAQLPNFTGVAARADPDLSALWAFFDNLHTLDPWALATGGVTLVTAIAARHAGPRVPYMIVAALAGSAFAYVVEHGGFASVPMVDALPARLTPLSIPSFDPQAWRQLAPAALALTVLGIAQTIPIARVVAARAGQRVDGNQELFGLGLSNIAGAFTSSMPTSGSVDRCRANFEAGAATPLAAVFAAALLALILLAAAPLAAYLPLSVIAALLLIAAWELVDLGAIRRSVHASRRDVAALAVTFVATLTVRLEFAIFVGMIASLLVCLDRVARASLTRVGPDPRTPQRRFAPVSANSRMCPQLDILRMDGPLFFGAVEHLLCALDTARRERPHATHVLLVGDGLDFIDVAGCESLVQASRILRDTGATLYLCNLEPGVHAALEHGGFLEEIGRERVWPTKADAVRALYRRFGVTVCERCSARIFTECHIALPNGMPRAVDVELRG